MEEDLAHKIKLLPSEIVYNNITTLRGNFFSHLTLARARYRSDVKSKYDNIFQFPYPTIVKSRKRIDEDVFNEFKDRYNELIEDEDKVKTTEFKGDVLRRSVGGDVWDITQLDNHEKIVPSWLREELREYYGSNFRIIGFKAYRHYPHQEAWKNETDYKSLFQWHQDPFPQSSLRLFIPISDFTDKNGATRYLSEEATKNIDLDYKLGWGDNPRELEEEYDVEILSAESGQPLFFNPQNILHRAGEVSEGETRDLLAFYVMPHSEPLPDDWTDTEAYNGGELFSSARKQFESV